MTGAVTIQIADSGGWTLSELKAKIENYVALLIKEKDVSTEQDKKAQSISSLRRVFHKYANPDLIPKEKEAWAMAAAEKHEIRYANIICRFILDDITVTRTLILLTVCLQVII